MERSLSTIIVLAVQYKAWRRPSIYSLHFQDTIPKAINMENNRKRKAEDFGRVHEQRPMKRIRLDEQSGSGGGYTKRYWMAWNRQWQWRNGVKRSVRSGVWKKGEGIDGDHEDLSPLRQHSVNILDSLTCLSWFHDTFISIKSLSKSMFFFILLTRHFKFKIKILFALTCHVNTITYTHIKNVSALSDI